VAAFDKKAMILKDMAQFFIGEKLLEKVTVFRPLYVFSTGR
jgi:hypothetical protein